MINKTDHDMITEIYSILCGNGNEGLCEQFKNHKKADDDFREGYRRFQMAVYVAAALLVGNGVLSVVQLVV